MIRRTPEKIDVAMEFSRCARAELAPRRDAGRGATGLSKLSSVRKTNVEVDVILGELNSRTSLPLLKPAESSNGFSAYRNEFPDSLERR